MREVTSARDGSGPAEPVPRAPAAPVDGDHGSTAETAPAASRPVPDPAASAAAPGGRVLPDDGTTAGAAGPETGGPSPDAAEESPDGPGTVCRMAEDRVPAAAQSWCERLFAP